MAGRRFERLDTIKSIEHGVYVEPVAKFTPRYNENLGWLPGMQPGPNYFEQPTRLVIDLEMDPVDPDLRINFRVYILKDDPDFDEIKLAKWDGTTWKLIPAEPIELPNHSIWAGYFKVENYRIGDPPIAVGR